MIFEIRADEHFGVQLGNIRKSIKPKISQTELARRTGTSASNVSHFERGDNTRGNGSIDTAIRHAKGLGASELRFIL